MGDADSSASTPTTAAAAAATHPPEKHPDVSPLSTEETTKKLKLTDEPVTPATTTTPATTAPDNNNSNEKSTTEEGAATSPEPESPTYTIQVTYNKNPFQMQVTPCMTVLELKQMIKERVGVDVHLQKVLLKGVAKDNVMLKDLGVNESTKKILVIGSTIQDVLKVKEVPSADEKERDKESSGASGSNWCSMTNHKKVIDKGLPDDVMPGILDEHDRLPPFPLSGMYSSKGSKVRLTFKLENDELWIGTKERTEKVPIGSIRNVTSQPITGYEHYHIIAIQLGPTEASRFFVYWVPAQYVEAIKDALTGA